MSLHVAGASARCSENKLQGISHTPYRHHALRDAHVDDVFTLFKLVGVYLLAL